MDKQFFTIKEASKYCMVSPETIRRWIRDEKDPLPAYNTGGRGLIKILKIDLDQYAEKYNILTIEKLQESEK